MKRNESFKLVSEERFNIKIPSIASNLTSLLSCNSFRSTEKDLGTGQQQKRKRESSSDIHRWLQLHKKNNTQKSVMKNEQWDFKQRYDHEAAFKPFERRFSFGNLAECDKK